jgi:lipopolysaccharide assembly protein A
MRILVWLLRAFVLFALFAFALNNRAEVVVQWFFGYHWQSPLVIVVFAAFAAGCAVGVLAMTPAWWRRRTVTQRQAAADKNLTHSGSGTFAVTPSDPLNASSSGPSSGPFSGSASLATQAASPVLHHPPREGL